MKQTTAYRVVDRDGNGPIGPEMRRELADFLAKDGQLLLPILELVQHAEVAVDEVIDVVGRAAIEAVLELSAREVAGAKRPGRRTDLRGKADDGGADVRWHGSQDGVVGLSDRKLRVRRPRLRRKGKAEGAGPEGGAAGEEVPIPAYAAMREGGPLSVRIAEILMRGVSTRSYGKVISEMADTVGVSKSSISREFVEASADQLRILCERRFDDVEILAMYIDGIVFGGTHVIVAVGVDAKGCKHVLGIREGASENGTVATALLEDLVERGVKPGRRRLFVVDGSKALRKAIDAVYGSENPVQRCRLHKIRNVVGHLPKDQHAQARTTMRAAYRLEAAEGMKRLRTFADWLCAEHPSAADSLLEGLEETFTVNRLDIPAKLRRGLCTTNVIENGQSGTRMRTRRVTNWQDGKMVMRWVATAMLASERNFRRVMGHEQIWMLKSVLDQPSSKETVAATRAAG